MAGRMWRQSSSGPRMVYGAMKPSPNLGIPTWDPLARGRDRPPKLRHGSFVSGWDPSRFGLGLLARQYLSEAG
eukprot:scaffold237_cov421-Prasinococcus_capsulatus_cf.AAC.5